MRGVVQSGASNSNPTAVSHATVRLYYTHVGTPSKWGETQTDNEGKFFIEDPTPAGGGIFYVTADLGQGVFLLALLGTQLPTHPIVVNELTTVAGAYCAVQFSTAAMSRARPSGWASPRG